jgi:adenylate cyclase
VNKYWIFEAGAGDSPTIPIVALQLFSMGVYEEFVSLLEKASPGNAGKLPLSRNAAIATKGVKELILDIREIFRSDPLIAERMSEELESSSGLFSDERKHRSLNSLIKIYGGGAASRYINFYGPPGSITTIPYYQALQLRDGVSDGRRMDVKGKAVFVGLSEVLLADRKDSFYTVYSRANGTFIGGVEIMATAFSNLLTDAPVRPVGLSAYILIILLWGLIVGVTCRVSNVGVAALAVAGMSVLYLLTVVYQFKTNYNWLPVVVPLFVQAPLAFVGGIVWNYVDIKKERQNIKNAFEHYLPKEVVNQLSKDIAHIQTGSQVVYGVCLFTDAEQYTTLSEVLPPHELGKFMNRYYETMFKPVKQHSGFVSGVIGDSMLALWVAARSEANLKNNACLAAIDINEELKQFKQKSTDALTLRTRIGLHCGQIMLGHVGALDHYEYTPMGDIVNTASRIEGLNKYLGTTLLVSGDVMHQVDGFLTRDLGAFTLKGKAIPIEIHELLCPNDSADEKQKTACTVFAEGLGAFRRQSWSEAIEKFNQSIVILGEDGPSQFYIGLCEQYLQNPPGEPWDGVVHMDKK